MLDSKTISEVALTAIGEVGFHSPSRVLEVVWQ